MKVDCSICGMHIGNKFSEVFGDEDISHGLCASCTSHLQAQLGVPLDQYLETMSVPVVLVSQEGIINIANSKAIEMLGKASRQVQEQKSGVVFECEYAYLSCGCGKTVHCSGCTIRLTVLDTMETGRPHRRVPATLRHQAKSESCEIEFLVSTEKKNGIVFLQIDSMNGVVF